MKQVGYVNESGKPIVHKKLDPRKVGMIAGFTLLVIMLVVFIAMLVKKSNKNKTCNKIEDTYASAAFAYAKAENTLPTIETESVTITGDELLEKGKVSRNDVMRGEEVCKAKITITKFEEEEDGYLKTVELTNCGYCTTEERYGKWHESDKLPTGNVIVSLKPTFNYYETTDYHTKWTPYYTEDYLSEKTDKTYGIRLLSNQRLMPKVPDIGHIVKIEKDDKTYYRYRDKRWRFYKNSGGSYSGYSSEQPQGYANKDTASARQTDWSEWSMDYPDVASYRNIKSTTGYRWYYKKGSKKIYWNSGAYTPEQPGEQYNKKDKKGVSMYSYRDTQWRWYNGTKRGYTSYTSVAPKGYQYRDEETVKYSDWSGWSEDSHKDANNSYYREEETQVKSRYRTLYQVYSLLKLDDYVDKAEFERLVGKTYKEFAVTPNIKVDIKYTYRYRKAK